MDQPRVLLCPTSISVSHRMTQPLPMCCPRRYQCIWSTECEIFSRSPSQPPLLRAPPNQQ
ncbi:hypothetical protein C8R48DRAFT_741456 [Suillus tomentosus]|nr:hypothetical protein C8R48DRAFT_741456 [Suillus tomentosus]